MSKKNWSSILSVLARTALAFVFVFGQTAWAGQNQNVKDKQGSNGTAKTQETQANQAPAPAAKAHPAEEENAPAQRSTAEENSQRGGPHEGIKVHGHWTIEVRNPDGTMVTHQEFENSLQASGATVLANVLNSGSVPGGWVIVLDGIPTSPWLSQPNGLDLSVNVSDTSALILPSGFSFFHLPLPDSNMFFNLISTSTGNGQLVLSGSALAAQSGSVSIVSTYLDTCGNVFSPTNCVNHTGGATGFLLTQFTAVTLSSPVQVSAGQTVAATVTISFS